MVPTTTWSDRSFPMGWVRSSRDSGGGRRRPNRLRPSREVDGGIEADALAGGVLAGDAAAGELVPVAPSRLVPEAEARLHGPVVADQSRIAASTAKMVDRVTRLVVRSQFKRRPPLIAKISTRSIGWDFRYPRDWAT